MALAREECGRRRGWLRAHESAHESAHDLACWESTEVPHSLLERKQYSKMDCIE